MKKRTIINLIAIIAITLLTTAGFLGMLFGNTSVRILCFIATLLVDVVALKIYRDGPVYL